MMPSFQFVVTDAPLSLEAASRAVAREDCGGVALFLGTVRSPNEGRAVERIRYTAYREMAEAELARIGREAAKKWEIGNVYLAHRIGEVLPGEPSLIVAVSAPHREAAFAACRYAVEELKRRAPVWKEEFAADGKRWVENPPGAP